MTSPCPVKTLGQIALPGVAFSNFLGAECWFAAPNTSHAGEAGIPINLVDPDNTTARLVAKKLQVNWGHVSAPQLKRILPEADGAGATKLTRVGERDVCATFAQRGGRARRLRSVRQGSTSSGGRHVVGVRP